MLKTKEVNEYTVCVVYTSCRFIQIIVSTVYQVDNCQGLIIFNFMPTKLLMATQT